METIAQEAKRLLEPIPDEQWLVGLYGTSKNSNCHCFLGHWNLLHGGEPDYSEHEHILNTHIRTFLKSRFIDGFSVNDGKCPQYQQSTPKQRVMALLDDMIAAGL